MVVLILFKFFMILFFVYRGFFYWIRVVRKRVVNDVCVSMGLRVVILRVEFVVNVNRLLVKGFVIWFIKFCIGFLFVIIFCVLNLSNEISVRCLFLIFFIFIFMKVLELLVKFNGLKVGFILFNFFFIVLWNFLRVVIIKIW